MTGYDIIGDVHGEATKLKALLAQLGYQYEKATGVYRHPERTAVFVGDLIDRGREQLEVLQLVKSMVDNGAAHIVMGNHEFNAIAYATADPDKPGKFLRDNDDPGNYEQHAVFLELEPKDREHYLEWFKTLPLWLTLPRDGRDITPEGQGEIRVVHACWHPDSMSIISETCPSNRLPADQFASAATKGTALYKAVEILLKGPEIDLHEYERTLPTFKAGGKARHQARVKWWQTDATTLEDLVITGKTEEDEDYPDLSHLSVKPDHHSYVYADQAQLFYGHYWRTWEPEPGQDWTDYTACVDFSGHPTEGILVAYQYNYGDQTINPANYVRHDQDAKN